MPPPIVDVHTHMYPQEYIDLLTSRTTLPLIRTFPSSPLPRLILLESELPLLAAATANPHHTPLPGRPLSPHFTSLPAKLAFMARHSITTSLLSLANPWLDFLPASTAPSIAHTINTSFSASCAAHPGKLYFLAALPLTAPLPDILTSITHAASLPHCRGVILGTSGLAGGAGLDDPAILPVFQALAAAGLIAFLHPHYGLPDSVFGPRAAAGEYGHVMPLALGFPVETTVAVTRMFMAGVFDAVPGLRVLLAHGGARRRFWRDGWRVVGGMMAFWWRGGGEGEGRLGRCCGGRFTWMLWFDGSTAVKAAVDLVGADRIMFGTDHPFFPPVGEGADTDGVWESVAGNVRGVKEAFGETEEGEEGARAVMGGNAIKVFRLVGE
ncbi:hypothetical protein B0T18DRAFT_6409 [Schizothecium vesticola]|uniref:Amidohydrolase-related domain-containing protein n=1 Tax=Schizothecium vesticola TaxID=314040 RepID=A0AA40F8B6_9PEZI|nr:hypothetical protein B0T18DRAFT_6409 [Schizothecium vesticola]